MHQIENNEMAYAGATPWHGLGVQVPAGTSGEDMLVAAKLNWKVDARNIALKTADGLGTTESPLAEYRAITRSDTDRVFGIASDHYCPVQNSEIVEFFREFCESGQATMETVGGLRGGAVVWALAKLNDSASAVIGESDVVHGYLLLSSSHDGTQSTSGMPTQVRVVCANTLAAAYGAAEKKSVYRLRHSTQFGLRQKEQAAAVMGMAAESVAATNVLAAALAKITLDDAEWVKWMARVWENEESIVDPLTHELTRTARAVKDATLYSPGQSLPSARGTLWGAVNGVTYWADHNRRAQNSDRRLTSAWFGDSARLKVRAMEVSAEMAGISR